jgi:hypothetical protein
LGDPLKGKLAAVLQTSALGGPTLSTGKGGGSRHQRAMEKGKRRRGETIRERGVGELGNPDVFSN